MNIERGNYACVKTPFVYKKLFGLRVALPNLFGWAVRIFTVSPYDHAFIYIGEGKIVEAQPRGAKISNLSKYDGCEMVWSNDDLTDSQRIIISSKAKSLVGTPYGFLDLVYLGLATLNIRFKWILDRVERENRLICSQLVAVCGKTAKEDLWQCGEPNACLVRPVDLANRIK